MNHTWLFGPVVLALFLVGCGRQKETPAMPDWPTAQVRVQTVEFKRVNATEEVVGTVRSRLRAGVEAKVGGRIVTMPVIAGQLLEQGELIAQLDGRETQARLDQARAALDQAERDLQRYATLMQQQVLTRAEFDAAESRQRMAKAAVVEAKELRPGPDVRGVVGGEDRHVADQGHPA